MPIAGKDMFESVVSLLEHWVKTGCLIAPGVPARMIATENERRVILPDEVRAYFMAANGLTVAIRPLCLLATRSGSHDSRTLE